MVQKVKIKFTHQSNADHGDGDIHALRFHCIAELNLKVQTSSQLMTDETNLVKTFIYFTIYIMHDKSSIDIDNIIIVIKLGLA